MEDKDVDTHLRQYLPGEPPREAFKEQTLRDSTAAFIRVQRLRCARRRVGLAAAAVLVAGVAFFGGRLSGPPALPMSADVAPRADAEPDGVTVSSDLIAWLEAARLFRQLGMEDRMARAVERAGRFLPVDTVTVGGQMGQVFAAGGFIENREKRIEPMGMPDPHSSAESVNQILAQSFGGHSHASGMD
jgi:hypothetical protein